MAEFNPYSRMLTVEDLAPLEDNDAEFRKAMIANIWDDARFAVFLEIEVIDQARDVLEAMARWTQGQMLASVPASAERRAWGEKNAQINYRLDQVEAEVERLDALEEVPA